MRPGGTLGGGFRGFRGRVVGGVLCFGAVLWYWVAVFGDGMGDGVGIGWVEGWEGMGRNGKRGRGGMVEGWFSPGMEERGSSSDAMGRRGDGDIVRVVCLGAGCASGRYKLHFSVSVVRGL